jgi:SMODS-associating 2TM, beta-strand rich effector domain
MKHLKLTRFLNALVFTSFVVGFIVVKVRPVDHPSFFNYLKIVPTVVTIDAVLGFIFIKYLWGIRIFRGWLVPFPNLNGSYKGTIQTTWTDPITNERPTAIPATLTINQSFFRISCVMRTKEMTSHSFLGDFILDSDEQVNKLAYSYSSEPIQMVIERSPQHLGTMIFEIEEQPKIKLVGQYWTGRKTTGTIEMKFWKQAKITTFPSDFGDHPVSAARNNRS